MRFSFLTYAGLPAFPLGSHMDSHSLDVAKTVMMFFGSLVTLGGIFGALFVGHYIIKKLPGELREGLAEIRKEIAQLFTSHNQLDNRVTKLEAQFEQRGALINSLREDMGDVRNVLSKHGEALARIEGAVSAQRTVHIAPHPSQHLT